MGHLHEARLAGRRARERALLVAEQLGLEELLRQRCAVDGHEALAGARAVGVNGAGDELLPGARLAQDEDVRLRARRLLHELEHLPDRRAGADDVLEPEGLLELPAQVAVLDLKAAMTQRTLHRHAQLLDREVLRQVVEGALADGRDRRLDRGERGDHDHGQRGIELVRAAEQLHAVHLGHLQVGEEEIGPLGLQQLERAPRVAGGEAAVLAALEHPHAVLHHVGLVVDDQDAGAGHGRAISGRVMAAIMAWGSRSPPSRGRRRAVPRGLHHSVVAVQSLSRRRAGAAPAPAGASRRWCRCAPPAGGTPRT